MDRMKYKIVERRIPVCLECGDKIRYGRTDKKFCCDDCRTRHHNRGLREGRSFRRKVLRMLDDNYRILQSLLSSDVTSIEISDIMSMGFSPHMVTSCRRLRSHSEYSCFDIKYIMTPSRISCISKIQNVSVPLHAGTETK